jgi:hypothetical protein
VAKTCHRPRSDPTLAGVEVEGAFGRADTKENRPSPPGLTPEVRENVE